MLEMHCGLVGVNKNECLVWLAAAPTGRVSFVHHRLLGDRLHATILLSDEFIHDVML